MFYLRIRSDLKRTSKWFHIKYIEMMMTLACLSRHTHTIRSQRNGDQLYKQTILTRACSLQEWINDTRCFSFSHSRWTWISAQRDNTRNVVRNVSWRKRKLSVFARRLWPSRQRGLVKWKNLLRWKSFSKRVHFSPALLCSSQCFTTLKRCDIIAT